tara:strand:+ start:518 stop:781 length:264 start_codon:yes stop_codon:yes gene_type:complete
MAKKVRSVKKRTVKKRPVKKVLKKAPKWHAVHLKGSFMLMAIVGFLVTAYLIFPENTTWGMAFLLVFGAMFVASIISMTKEPLPEEK